MTKESEFIQLTLDDLLRIHQTRLSGLAGKILVVLK